MNQPDRILIVKPSALGDVVTAMPVLRGLRKAFPAAHIAWLLSNSCAPLLDGDSDLSEIILFDRKKLGSAWRSPGGLKALLGLRSKLREGRFDWVIDLQGLFRSGCFTGWTKAPLRAGFADAREGATKFYTHKVAPTAAHTIERNVDLLRQLGVPADGNDMTLRISPAAAAVIGKLCEEKSLSRGQFVVCVPPTRWPTKRYAVRHWRAVVGELAGRMPVALIGSPDPAERQLCAAVVDKLGPGVIDLSGQTTVPQMVALIAASAGVVCSDSSAKFVAPAVGVDCVCIVGPTRVDLTGPYLRGWAVVADVPCQGCLRRKCLHTTCMEVLPPSQVMEAVDRMLRPRPACPPVAEVESGIPGI